MDDPLLTRLRNAKKVSSRPVAGRIDDHPRPNRGTAPPAGQSSIAPIEDRLRGRAERLEIRVDAREAVDLLLEPAVERALGPGIGLRRLLRIIGQVGDRDHQGAVRSLLEVPALVPHSKDAKELRGFGTATSGELGCEGAKVLFLAGQNGKGTDDEWHKDLLSE